MASSNPTGVHAKLASVRRSTIEVTKVREADSAFASAEAAAVFAEVKPKLDSRKLVVTTSMIGEPTLTMGQAKVLASVRLSIRLVDTEAEIDHPDRELVCEWAGAAWVDPESAGASIGAAATIALKGWYVHTFAVSLLEPEHEPDKLYKVTGAKKVTPAQITNFIGAAQREAGLSGEQVMALANGLCDAPISGLAELPQAAADALVDLMKTVGAQERAKARQPGAPS